MFNVCSFCIDLEYSCEIYLKIGSHVSQAGKFAPGQPNVDIGSDWFMVMERKNKKRPEASKLLGA